MSTYKGSLKSKRKPELAEIATALSLHDNPNSIKREEIEDLVREHLIHNKDHYASDSTFKGLIDSLDHEERRRRSARSSSVNGESDVSDSPDSFRSPRKHSQRAISSLMSTPVASSSAAAQDLTNSIKQKSVKARKSIDKLVDGIAGSAAGTVRNAGEEINTEVHEAQAEAAAAVQEVQNHLKKSYRKAKKHGYKLFTEARVWLSDSRHLTIALLAFEAILLLLSAVPTTFVEIGSRGPYIPLINPKQGINGHLPHWAATIPDPRGLVSFHFWRPVVLWTLFSVLVPGAVAHLITFDRKSQPSALSFLLARVSILALFTRVLNRHTLDSLSLPPPAVLGVAAGEVPGAHNTLANAARGFLSYDHVLEHVGTDIQLWATTTALGFAVYEALASRPRAS